MGTPKGATNKKGATKKDFSMKEYRETASSVSQEPPKVDMTDLQVKAKEAKDAANKYIFLYGKNDMVKVIPKTGKKICIMGFAPSSRDLAPFNEMDENGKPVWEIWGENNLYNYIPRVDVLFQMHDLEEVKRYGVINSDRGQYNGSDHYKWLKEAKIPIVMQDHYPDIPYSAKYPLEEMNSFFEDYWTNSISYMIAMAVLAGPDEICIYGVDMARGSEYTEQRASVEYFIGVAKGAGIKVIVPNECDLLKSFTRYGYQDQLRSKLAAKRDARIRELNDRRATYIQEARKIDYQIEEFKLKKEQCLQQAMVMQGAIDDTEFWFRNMATLDQPKGST